MPRSPTRVRPGLPEALALWALYAAELAAIYRTHARLPAPPGSTVPPGPAAGVRQAAIFLAHPCALAALPLGTVALARLSAGTIGRAPAQTAAIAGGAAALTLPLTRGRVPPLARALAAATGSALGLTLAAIRSAGIGEAAPRQQGDGARLVIGIGVLGLALPWLLADVGVYVGDLPLLGKVYLSRQRLPPGARGPAVHLGHHHGMDGALLAWTGLALSRQLGGVRPPIREPLSLILAFLLVYGLARTAEDFWYEQVVKRGWTGRRLPRLVVAGRPTGRGAWALLGAATGLVHVRLRGHPGGVAGGRGNPARQAEVRMVPGSMRA